MPRKFFESGSPGMHSDLLSTPTLGKILRAGGFFWPIWLDMRRKPTKHGTNPEVALARIKEGFDVEWSNPTGP